MLLDEPLDLGDAPAKLREALYTLARVTLDRDDTSLTEEGFLAHDQAFYSSNYDKMEEAAASWRSVRKTFDGWRAQCPPENLAEFDSLVESILPHDGADHWDAFYRIQGDGIEYSKMSYLYLISVKGLAGEYAKMMLNGVNFTRTGSIAISPAETKDPWDF